MVLVKNFGKVIIMFSLITSGVLASSNTGIVAGLVAGLVAATTTSNSNNRQSTQQRTTKRKSSIPSNCSKERWTTQSLNNKEIATNFQGILVTYDEMGELIIQCEIKNTLPSMFKPGDKVQLTAQFSNKSSRSTSATIDETSKNLLITGIDAIYIANKLKSSSYVKIDFANNKYCSRLKSSSKSIKTVESSARFFKLNKPDNEKQQPLTLVNKSIIYFPVNGKKLSIKNKNKVKALLKHIGIWDIPIRLQDMHQQQAVLLRIIHYHCKELVTVRNTLLASGINENNILSVDALGEESLRYNTKYEEKRNRAVVIKAFGR